MKKKISYEKHKFLTLISIQELLIFNHLKAHQMHVTQQGTFSLSV
jgi:hypothetical protein